MSGELEKSTLRKVFLRIIPFIMLLYFMVFIDRVNIGFASLQMNKDLGLSPTVFGFGAGIFFWGYFLCEIPSNIALHRFGARLWIARIMVSWGILAAIESQIQGPTSFYILRFLLGAAEAGFFPGVILYLSFWFPARQRAAAVSLFMASAPLSTALGSPLASTILGMNGALGLAGWQWLFILEAIPAVLLGLRDARLHDRSPGTGEVARRRSARMAGFHHERRARRQGGDRDPQRLAGACRPARARPGARLFRHVGRPLHARRLGAADHQELWPVHLRGRSPERPAADRRRCRHGPLVPAFGPNQRAALARHRRLPRRGRGPRPRRPVDHVVAVVAALMLVNVGIVSAKPPLWSMPTMFLSGPAAAAGLAAINSIGNLGGFAGPAMIGWIKSLTGSFSGGLYFVAARS